MAAFQNILLEAGERIARIVINRPEKANALNYVVIRELKEAFNLCENDPNTKVIILKANGGSFCAGMDVEYVARLQEYGLDENLYDVTHLAELYEQIYKCKKLVIAQVEGPAFSTGAGILTVCDLVYMTPNAAIGFREVKLGFVPALCAKFLINKIGMARSRELLLCGDTISAQIAEHIGFANRILNAEDIDDFVLARALQIGKENSQGSLELTKRLLGDVCEMPIIEALTFATRMTAHARGSAESHFGAQTFLEKKIIDW